jgi:hypothetical protein
MAKQHHELLAESLARAKKVTLRGILRAENISRLDRERLEAGGWLTRILRGWYLLKQPKQVEGDTTQWYSSFWDFISFYLDARFGDDYCLSANASIELHVGKTTIPHQVLVMVKKGGSSIIQLPFNTSIAIYQEVNTFPSKIEKIRDINIMPIESALHRASAKFYQLNPDEAEIALKTVDIISLSRELLSGENIASANRIIGAYYFMNDVKRAKKLELDLTAAGYQLAPTNPFIIDEPTLLNIHSIKSPYAARIKLLWQKMRENVLTLFPNKFESTETPKKYFEHLEKIYTNDAYNSLSIEGYEVSEELIGKIAEGKWDPDQSSQDKSQINAMAAKGYHLAFNAVKLSINRIFHKENAGDVIKEDIHSWYSALFSPSVKAGILKPQQLAGFRTHQVYIRGSMHTPLPPHALMDAMEAYWECVISEPSPAVRAVLGHFIFVFIHPYMDGNGRIGRFIMNSLFASGKLPWTIINVKRRAHYMKALEAASVKQDIQPFAKFILEEMNHQYPE